MDKKITNSIYQPDSNTSVNTFLPQKTEESPSQILKFINENFMVLPDFKPNPKIGQEIATPIEIHNGVEFMEKIVPSDEITSIKNSDTQFFLKIIPIIPTNISDEKLATTIKKAIAKLIDATLLRSNIIPKLVYSPSGWSQFASAFL